MASTVNPHDCATVVEGSRADASYYVMSHDVLVSISVYSVITYGRKDYILNFPSIKTGILLRDDLFAKYLVLTSTDQYKCINRSFRHSAILGGNFSDSFMI